MGNFAKSLDKKKGRTLVPSPPAPQNAPPSDEPEAPPKSEKPE